MRNDCEIVEGFQVTMEDKVESWVHKCAVWWLWRGTYLDSPSRKDYHPTTGSVFSTWPPVVISVRVQKATSPKNHPASPCF